ncbi:cbs domain containing protein [Cytophagaceae bacterium BD1B2-1]|uniref:Cbs domain containing protein n=2 Tax=Xanthocytophaga agilis TaxID=3048010 RepID=A0AAE3R5W9_9BACT|nr:cbs domain containing protein [Xanthocytophaga agilis]
MLAYPIDITPKTMIAEEFLNRMIPLLKPTDSATFALDWMQELHLFQLPVVNDGEYLGLVSQSVLVEQPAASLAEITLEAQEIYSFRHEPYLDVLKTAKQNHLQVIAIVDTDQSYVGTIVVDETLAFFAQSQEQSPGSTLVLLMEERDYSLTEISRLVESNDAKIVSSYVNTYPYDKSKIQLTIKINRMDITRIIATFERFEYDVIAKYQHESGHDEDKERLDMLLKYLSI